MSRIARLLFTACRHIAAGVDQAFQPDSENRTLHVLGPKNPTYIRLESLTYLCIFLWVASGSVVAAEPPSRPATSAATAPAVSPSRNITDLKGLERKMQQVVAKVSPSVVSVADGSGVVVSSDGYVLTVAHVAEKAGRQVVVVFPDGRRARAVTLGNDYGVDAGMAKISEPGPWPYVAIGNSDELKPGQWCLTIGYPVTFEHGKPPLVRIGRVLQNVKTELITDATIMGGDSGAPLFDLDGKVIAIGSTCDDRTVVHNIYVPIDRFRDGWKQLAAGEDFNSLAPKRAMLGVGADENTDDARIGSIVPGSAAEKAGLKPGDVVLKFEDRPIQTYEELPPLIWQRRPGDKVKIAIRRGGETLELRVTLGAGDPMK
jgi:serine protease Do